MNMQQYKVEADKLTLEHAKEWNDSIGEQFIYCIDYLMISAHDGNADTLVNAMEARMVKMLMDAGIPVND